MPILTDNFQRINGCRSTVFIVRLKQGHVRSATSFHAVLHFNVFNSIRPVRNRRVILRKCRLHSIIHVGMSLRSVQRTTRRRVNLRRSRRNVIRQHQGKNTYLRITTRRIRHLFLRTIHRTRFLGVRQMRTRLLFRSGKVQYGLANFGAGRQTNFRVIRASILRGRFSNHTYHQAFLGLVRRSRNIT